MNLDPTRLVYDLNWGRVHVVPSRFSQHTFSGRSACGLAALNFLRMALGMATANRGFSVVYDLVSEKVTSEILSICAQYQVDRHLDVEDIKRLKTESTLFDEIPCEAGFLGMLNMLSSVQGNVGVAITRPPHIISCVKLVLEVSPGAWRPVYIVFDSTNNAAHPSGAGFAICPSAQSAAEYLTRIIPYHPTDYASVLPWWEARQYETFSAHFFVMKPSPPPPPPPHWQRQWQPHSAYYAYGQQAAPYPHRDHAHTTTRQTADSGRRARSRAHPPRAAPAPVYNSHWPAYPHNPPRTRAPTAAGSSSSTSSYCSTHYEDPLQIASNLDRRASDRNIQRDLERDYELAFSLCVQEGIHFQ
ncbi:hypothetical protein HMN09_00684900 [Mycena chlorophos]|uniref:Uncharacterized protein n=1 Tax=Mycena chlorophos TaxID=658473 RepID=A0A8H6SZX3_MYCCL|nr:hypothetical protein HMN09_00684900 [Mycena chlorophos]